MATTRQVLLMLGWLCMLAAWLLPNHYQPWASFYNEAAMGSALALLALTPQRWCGVPAAAWGLVAVACIPWAQWAVGQLAFSGDAWVASLYLLATATAVCIGCAHARAGDGRDFAAFLSTVLLVAAVLSSVMAMAQCLRVGNFGIWVFEIGPGARAVANVAQPNNLATLIAFGALGLWLLYEQRRVGAIAAASVLLPLLIGVTLTASRTALLFVPMALAMHQLTRHRGVAWRTGAPALLAVFAVQLLFTRLWPMLSEALLLGTADALGERGIESARFVVWPVLLDAVSMSPWTGYGWLQVGAAQLAAAEHHPSASEMWLHGHNLLLELLVWCGVPLGGLLCVLLILWFVTRVAAVRSVEAAIGMILVAELGVHALLELPHHYAFFLLPVGLWVGIVEHERGARTFGARRFAPALAGLSLAMAIAVAWDYGKVEADFWLMRFETRGIGDVRAAQPAPDAPFLSGLTAFLRSTRAPVTAGMSSAQLEALRVIVTRYPYSPSLYGYATALALNQRQTEALLVFDKLRHVHGEARYREMRVLLHQRVLDGQTELAAFDAALPP